MDWYEDEGFWERFYPAMFGPNKFATAQEEIDQLLALTGVQAEQGPALDLACGPGRHSKALAERGFQVTGVDRSPFLLQKAREYTTDAGTSNIELVQADMRAFVRPFAYQLAVNLFSSFGYFDSIDQDLLVLKCVHTSLAPGGIAVFDMVGKEILARKLDANPPRTLDNGTVLEETVEVLPNWARIRNTWTLKPTGGEEIAVQTFELNCYSGIELVALLTNAGFKDVELFGSLAGSPYDAAAERLIARARK